MNQNCADENEIAQYDYWPKATDGTNRLSRRFLFGQICRNFFHERYRPWPLPDSVEPFNWDSCFPNHSTRQRPQDRSNSVRIPTAVQGSGERGAKVVRVTQPCV